MNIINKNIKGNINIKERVIISDKFLLICLFVRLDFFKTIFQRFCMCYEISFKNIVIDNRQTFLF